MNKQELDILNILFLEPFINQRILSEASGHSLGVVNKSIKTLIKEGFLDDTIRFTKKASQEFQSKAPKNAIILAAGFGMRMIPINTKIPKALLEVNGEPLIERIIKQLHEVDIKEIYIVVGFMKKKLEYLINKFHVKLIINKEYETHNNLHSLNLAADHLSNTYIIPCDIYCDKNPFRRQELYSWYMIGDIVDNESNVRVNRQEELKMIPKKQGGNTMIGIAYLIEEQSSMIKKRLQEYDQQEKYRNAFWEETLYEKDHMMIQARVVHATDVVEINTYEQLRELDEESNQLKSDAISMITKTLHTTSSKIVDITVLKKGMTNRSFLFMCKNKKYIMRIPGEGTDQLINREEEAAVYTVINRKGICDDIIYINPKNGYKITEFIYDARVCNANNVDDLKLCMKKLREFHQLKLVVPHEFPIFEKIEFYESLWSDLPSLYKDYKRTKENVFSLKKYIDPYIGEKCLTHMDAVSDNFLLTKQGDVKLIDWEYAGMQDPHVDIAMFCIYSLYNKQQVDQLIDIYFEGTCPYEIRIKIYSYIAVCGLLWSNWCEYKRSLGVTFGEYAFCQYQYAKDYYKIVREELEKHE